MTRSTSSSTASVSVWTMRFVTAVVVVIMVASCLCSSLPPMMMMVEAGIAQGFHDEVPSMDDVAYAFDQAQRQLLEEANRFDASNLETSSKIAAKTQSRRTQTESSTDGEEVSFMIFMDEFDYSNGADEVTDLQIGTKFAFTGRIVTKAEELGVASGSCTITSDARVDLSYCVIYHRLDTDNFGGYGTVMASGSSDEVGGRLLVTGTGGTLASTQEGYAMIQFDPAGNPVIYVLLKLFGH